ncbi:MAG: phosphoglycerate dehydrogenase [Candidatus Omnitrophica bacterium]|nr:phosphoglycerate dehydrogenase [Candidatus Omnitrophota bacterium]
MKPLSDEKILISTSSFAVMDNEPLDMLKNAGCRVVDNPYKRRLTKPEIEELLATGITGIIAGLEPLDKEVLSKSNLKVISRCGSGLSNVDLDAAKDLGIRVCYTPDGPVSSVAELTIGAMLSLLRMIPLMDRELHDGRWSKKTGNLLEGKTVLIVGFGRIARRLKKLLEPFNVRILVADPFLKEKIEGISVIPLEEALPQADIISIHASGEGTIIEEKELGLIKPGGLLLNAARGTLVDEKALIKALREKRIAGAWLDVFEEEPYKGPLTKFDQVMLTPHVGSYTAECRKKMETEAVENLIEAFKKIKEGKR